MRIGILAALPGELSPLVRGWTRLPVARGAGVRMWKRREEPGANEILAVCAGMGAPAARRAFAAAEFAGAMDLVLSVGWAGALVDHPGTSRATLVPTEVIDAQTGERFRLTEARRTLRLVTTVRVADAAEKQRLARSYEAAAVDMEAAAVARLAEIRRIPFLCFKAISDDAGADLPDLNPFIDLSGHMKMPSFLAHVAVRPHSWPALLALGRRSAAASVTLAETLREFLADPDAARWLREGGPHLA